MKTLIIDDDPDVAEAVSLCFEIRWPDTQVLTARDGASGLRMFKEFGADFVLLDLGLPDMDGVDVCRELRMQSDVGIVMLTARDRRTDVIRGLESGADDFMTKPFGQMELLARARAVLRRGVRNENSNGVFANGRLTVNVEGREVRMDGEVVRLTPTEFSLVLHLAQNSGKLVTHADLLSRLWGEEYSEATDYLTVHVMHLRRKLGDDAGNPTVILTERSVGYKLVA